MDPAQNAEFWRRDAEAACNAALLLFKQGPGHWFSASLLAHHAIELLLKSALIREGYTVKKGRPENGWVWGHDTEKLASLLGAKRPDFSRRIAPAVKHLRRFDAFFNELRYPAITKDIDYLGPGDEEANRLTGMMDLIRPFAFPLPQDH